VSRSPKSVPAPAGRNPFAPSSDVITSRENQWLKAFRAALHHSGVPKDDRIAAEGPHLLEEALRSNAHIEAILLSPSGEHHFQRMAALLDASSRVSGNWPQVLRTTDRLLQDVAATEAPQGIAALLRPPVSTFDDLLRGAAPLVLVLIGVQDPGNVGTAIRSAEAFSATGVIATRGTAHPLAPKALRASAGSALRLPLLCGLNPPVAMAQLRIAGVNLCAASSGTAPDKSATSLSQVDFRAPLALLIGNEGAGLCPDVEASADIRVRISLADTVESLNAGVAASILLYEAARQRGLLR
jgi:RNA methyltransferase, TrmH family